MVAAALLYAERRLRGAVPFWPTILAKMTGYEDMATPELTVAVRSAQKLSRKLVYAQMYKAQLTALSSLGSGGSSSGVGEAGTSGGGPRDLLQPLPAEWHSAAGQDVQADGGKAGSPSAAAATMGRKVESLELLTQAVQALSTAAKAVAGPGSSMAACLAPTSPSALLAAAQNWSLEEEVRGTAGANADGRA